MRFVAGYFPRLPLIFARSLVEDVLPAVDGEDTIFEGALPVMLVRDNSVAQKQIG